MLLLNQVITQEEINSFKQFFQDYQSKKYINYQVGDQIIDHRLIIPKDSPLFDIIKRIVATNFSNPVDFWSAYQQQTVPHTIHIDDYGSDLEHPRYTYILAMDSVPEFKAIIWKEKCCNNDALYNFVEQWGKLKKFKKKISNISEVEDLEHTFDFNQDSYMADYLTLDGVYTYQVGTACLFDASQLHCTSNWVKYNKFPHRELLQIHVLSDREPIF
jgi:hypothetical protein